MLGILSAAKYVEMTPVAVGFWEKQPGVVMLTGSASPLGALTGRAHCPPIGRHYRGVETLGRHYWTPHCLEAVLHFLGFVGMNRVL